MNVPTLAPPSPSLRLEDLEKALRRAWSRETSIDRRGWRVANPAWGQCAVTALVVQDLLGGSIRRGMTPSDSHYWNRLPSGEEIDLTRHQFGADVSLTAVEERDRDYLLSDEGTRGRYALLREAVMNELNRRGER